jgi:hypothetical protein
VNTLKRLGELEKRMWVSLYIWVFRRPVTAKGEQPFGYARTLTPLMIAFIGVSIVELPILHFLLPGVWKIVADVLSAYALLWMFGLLASLRITPHAIGPDGLRIRGSGGLDLTIPWDYIADVKPRNRTGEKGRDGMAYNIGVMKLTSVDIELRHPTILELPNGDSEPVTSVRIAADEPAALTKAAHQHLESSTVDR